MGSIHLKCEETKIITSIIAGEIMPRIRADVLYGKSNEKNCDIFSGLKEMSQ